MPQLVEIAKPFTLLRDDNTYKKFYPGPQHVTDNEAEHWYVKLHLVGAVTPDNSNPVPGSAAHAEMLKAQHDNTLRQFRMEAEAKGISVEALQKAKHDAMLTEITANTKVEAKRASRRVQLTAKRNTVK